MKDKLIAMKDYAINKPYDFSQISFGIAALSVAFAMTAITVLMLVESMFN